MLTFWLVALLIGLLIFDFSKQLFRNRTVPWRIARQIAWTGSDSLLALSSATSIFCLGLAWRYYTGSLDGEISLQSDWLPYVVVVLILCLMAGFVQSWRDAEDAHEPIEDPYHLLETSQPLTEAPFFQSEQSKKFAMRGMTLGLSILIGFVGAAVLLQINVDGSARDGDDKTFFAQNRVRPTPLPTTHSALIMPSQQSVVDVPANTEPSANSKPSPSEPLIVTTKDGLQNPSQNLEPAYATRDSVGATLPAIGGPVGETPLEAITTSSTTTSAAPNSGHDGVAVDTVSSAPELPPLHTIVVRATLGVKARQLPSTSSNTITLLKYGNQYQALGRTSNGAWIQIVLNSGELAWIIAAAIDGSLFDSNQQVVAIDDLPVSDSY